MKLLLREYISMMKESGELDVLVPDLLLAMGLRPLSKAQVGVRQHGVDASAVGTDSRDGEEKLFLVTIKPGDVTRSSWHGSPTAIKPSLDEILNVYLTQKISPDHVDLPKKIVLCCGGELKQDTEDNWKGYKTQHQEEGVAFELWDGNKLALLIEEHFLDEYLFPDSNQSLMRKALSLLDQSTEEPSFFYKLVEEILFSDEVSQASKKQRLKALRLISLCLGVTVRWNVDVENTRPAVLSAERTVLRSWDFLRKHDMFEDKKALKAFGSIHSTYLNALQLYVRRLKPLCLIEDGLSGFSGAAEPLEYPLRTFEALGVIATLGINHALLSLSPGMEDDLSIEHNELADVATRVLISAIRKNNAANTPLYDGHMIEIALGAFLMNIMGAQGALRSWIVAIINQVSLAYRLGKYFPVATDDYDDHIDLEIGKAGDKRELMNLSTIFPLISNWFALLGLEDDYQDFRAVINRDFRHTNLQLWFPEEQTESFLYQTNASQKTGNTFSSIELPETTEELRQRMRQTVEEHDTMSSFSFVQHGFPALGLIASRHFRTPVIPGYWQRGVRLFSESGQDENE